MSYYSSFGKQYVRHGFRIISQDGTVDVPYEDATFAIQQSAYSKETNIYAYSMNKYYRMATYRERVKAVAELENMRLCFCSDYHPYMHFQFVADQERSEE